MAAGPVPGTSPFAGHPPQGDDADTAVRHARSTQTRATARHRTAAGDSELDPAALPPTVVRMWSDHGRIDLYGLSAAGELAGFGLILRSMPLEFVTDDEVAAYGHRNLSQVSRAGGVSIRYGQPWASAAGRPAARTRARVCGDRPLAGGRRRWRRSWVRAPPAPSGLAGLNVRNVPAAGAAACLT